MRLVDYISQWKEFLCTCAFFTITSDYTLFYGPYNTLLIAYHCDSIHLFGLGLSCLVTTAFHEIPPSVIMCLFNGRLLVINFPF